MPDSARQWMMRGVAVALIAVCGGGANSAVAEESDSELASELANPLANLISIPFQGNYNAGIGPTGGGERIFVNVQPVIPFSLDADWNLITRTIVPITWQDDIFPGAGTQFGLGNATTSLFLSPSRVSNGITWGIGPVMLLPTHTGPLLGLDTWGVGPTAVGLWQNNGWTVGMLANQIWSVAGSDDDAISAALLQPFISYTTPDAWTFSLNTESAYDWKEKAWSVPVNATVSKLVLLGGKLPVSFFGGVRYWAESPEGRGPDGWGARFGFTVLLPRGGG